MKTNLGAALTCGELLRKEGQPEKDLSINLQNLQLSTVFRRKTEYRLFSASCVAWNCFINTIYFPINSACGHYFSRIVHFIRVAKRQFSVATVFDAFF